MECAGISIFQEAKRSQKEAARTEREEKGKRKRDEQVRKVSSKVNPRVNPQVSCPQFSQPVLNKAYEDCWEN